MLFLAKRGEEAEKDIEEFSKGRELEVMFRAFERDFFCRLEIFDEVFNHGSFIEEGVVLEMEEEGAVVEVDGTDGGDFPVDNGSFRMEETGSIFVNLDTGSQESGVETAAHAVDELFIRDAGHKDFHVDTAFGGAEKGVHKRVAEHEVGGVEICVFRRLRQEFDVEVVRDGGFRERGVVVREDVAVFDRGDVASLRKEAGGVEMNLERGKGVPKFDKHFNVVFNRGTREAETDVLPMVKPHFLVNVFVGEVNSAGIGDFSVDDEDFTVVAVVQSATDEEEGVKDVTFNSLFPESESVFSREGRKRAEVVIKNPDVDAGFGFFRHDVKHGVEHGAVIENKIFDEDVAFRGF